MRGSLKICYFFIRVYLLKELSIILILNGASTNGNQLQEHHVLPPHNCSSYLPREFVVSILNESMESNLTFASLEHSVPRVKYHSVPEGYVVACLKGAPYDNHLMPHNPITETGSSSAAEADFEDQKFAIRFAFSVCEVLALDFDGTLRIWGQLEIVWTDKRLAWDTSVFNESPEDENSMARNESISAKLDGHVIEKVNDGNESLAINNTNLTEADHQNPSALRLIWPGHILYPSELVWSPVLRVLNCHGDGCYVRVPSNSSALIQADGEVVMKVPKTFESTCNIRFEYFPFDNQTCEILLVAARVNLARLTVEAIWEEVITPYVETDSEWVVSALMYRPEAYVEHVLHLADSGRGRWKRSNRTMLNKTLAIRLELVRSASYYIYNLIVPLLVLVLIQLATTLVPANAEDKPTLLLAVMLPFFFYQTIVAEVSPKTARIPLLGNYVMSSLVLALLNFAASCLLLRMYRASPRSRPPPQRLARFITAHPHIKLQTLIGMALAGVRAGRSLRAGSLSGQNANTSLLPRDITSNCSGVFSGVSQCSSEGDKGQSTNGTGTRKLSKWSAVRESVGLEKPPDNASNSFLPLTTNAPMAETKTEPITACGTSVGTAAVRASEQSVFGDSVLRRCLSKKMSVCVNESRGTQEKLLGWKQLSHHLTRLWNTCFLVAQATLFVLFMVPLIRAWLDNEGKTYYLSLAT